MASKESLYKEALEKLGEVGITSTSEDRKARYWLDEVYDNNGIKRCLQQGLWYFATRTIEESYNSAIEPDFGFRRAFDIPSDFVRIDSLCADEYFSESLKHYHIEQDYIFCDLDLIYLRYVSNDASYGGNIGEWPEHFAEFAAWYFAKRIGPRLTGSEELKDKMELRYKDALMAALNLDAMDKPPRRTPPGSWERARTGRSGWGDRGTTNRLTS